MRGEEGSAGRDVLKHIEFPLWISVVGIPIFSVLGACGHARLLRRAVAARVHLAAAHLRALDHLRQLDGAHLVDARRARCRRSRSSRWARSTAPIPASNLIPAGMTAEIAVQRLQPALGHQARLHARRQAAPAGDRPRDRRSSPARSSACRSSSCCSCRRTPNGIRSAATIVSDSFAMPAALQWKGVAELITKGVSSLPLLGGGLDDRGRGRRGRDRDRAHRHQGPLPALARCRSAWAWCCRPKPAFAMWVGAMIFWWHGTQAQDGRHARATSSGSRAMEPICAGLISGAALVGIGNAIVNVLL